jgi:hypothetical protein
VLWGDEYWGSVEKSPLKPLGAFTSHGECAAVQTSKIKELASDPTLPKSDRVYDEVETLGNMAVVNRYSKSTRERIAVVIYRFSCFPDTVDPRGPKEK